MLRKPSLGVNPPRFIKTHLPALHNLLHFPLCLLIKSGASIACGDISRKVEIGRSEAGFDIIREGGRKANVDIVRKRYEVVPSVSSKVERWWR